MRIGKRQPLLAPVFAGLALILFPAGCCHVPTLLFQSHAQTPAWVKAAPAPSGKEAFFVGSAWARDRLDEDYVLVHARAAVASQLADMVTRDVAIARGAALLPGKPSSQVEAAAAALTAALAPREVYWEQWQRTCALSFTSKSYLYYILFAVPQAEIERLRAMGTARPAP